MQAITDANLLMGRAQDPQPPDVDIGGPGFRPVSPRHRETTSAPPGQGPPAESPAMMFSGSEPPFSSHRRLGIGMSSAARRDKLTSHGPPRCGPCADNDSSMGWPSTGSTGAVSINAAHPPDRMRRSYRNICPPVPPAQPPPAMWPSWLCGLQPIDAQDPALS